MDPNKDILSVESLTKAVNDACGEVGVTSVQRAWVGDVFTKVNDWLVGSSLMNSGDVGSIETLFSSNQTVARLNSSASMIGNADKAGLVQMLRDLKVPEAQIPVTATMCLRAAGGKTGMEDILANAEASGDKIDTRTTMGVAGATLVSRDIALAQEAFGQDANNTPADNRLSVALTILRTKGSVMDKLIARIAENSNYIVIKTDMGEVYNLANSRSSDPAVRNGAETRRPLAEMFLNPDLVNSTPQPVIPVPNNDTATVRKLLVNVESTVTDPSFFVSGVTANLWSLVTDANRIGYQATDYSDLLAEGGKINSVAIKVTQGTGSSAVSEIFVVPVGYQEDAKFAQSNNTSDSLLLPVNLHATTTLRAGSTTVTGATSTIFAGFTKTFVKVNITNNVTLNLGTGNITGTGTAEPVQQPARGQTSLDAAEVTAFGGLTVTFLGYKPELFFDEQNMRKTNIAVRVKTKTNTFTIPQGRNYIFDLALQQETDQSTLGMISTVSALGNSIRSLTICQSTLNEVADRLEFLEANPELKSMVDPRNMSIASSLVIPTVMRGTLDLDDGLTFVMRESERLTEGWSRLRQTLLYALSEVMSKSLMNIQLNPSEAPVFKVLTHYKLRSILFGIKDYHTQLENPVTQATGADLSMGLPNGFRLDIAATNFTSMEDTILFFPVRDDDPRGVTSFATTRERGMYNVQYNPINADGVSRRVVQNTREIPLVTNPCGGILTIKNLSSFLSSIEAQYAPVP